MSTTELNDNLTFLSAVQTLKRLVSKGLLTDAEAKTAEENLRKKRVKELFVVEEDCPHISAAAKRYGEPLEDSLLVYDYNDLYGGKQLVEYEGMCQAYVGKNSIRLRILFVLSMPASVSSAGSA